MNSLRIALALAIIVVSNVSIAEPPTTQPQDATTIEQQIVSLKAQNDSLPPDDPRHGELALQILNLKQKLKKLESSGAQPTLGQSPHPETNPSRELLQTAGKNDAVATQRVHPRPDQVTAEQIAYKRKLLRELKQSKDVSKPDKEIARLIEHDGAVTPEMVNARRDQEVAASVAARTSGLAEIDADITAQRKSCDDDIKAYADQYQKNGRAGTSPSEYAIMCRKNLQDTIKIRNAEKMQLTKATMEKPLDGAIAAKIIGEWDAQDRALENKEKTARLIAAGMCPVCEGTGKNYAYARMYGTEVQDCSACNGSGKTTPRPMDEAAAPAAGTGGHAGQHRCERCGGLGKIGSDATGLMKKIIVGDSGPIRDCPDCNGTGWVPDKP